MDAADILDDMLAALKGELAEGYSTIEAFAERQSSLLAKQAAHLARERASGFLRDDDALFQFFMEGLERDSLNMARSIAMLTILTIEKAWNAVTLALWGGIRTIMQAAGVPSILLPEDPPLSM